MKTSLTAADPSGWYECSLLNDSSEFRAIIWDGKQMLLGTNRILGPYTNFRRLFTESDVAALNEELRTLREELSRLKSQPYEMRLADKPDCVGIWCDKEAEILTIEEPSELSFPFLHPPYFYLGPIPVVVEQQPPKVVRVRYMDNEYDAIRVRHFGFVLLGHDGNGERYVTKEESEEVQS